MYVEGRMNSADFQELYVMIRYMNYSCSLLTALQYITHSSYYSNILQLVIISQNVEYFFCRSNPVYQQELHHYHHLLHVLLLRTHSSQFQGFCFTKSCREIFWLVATILDFKTFFFLFCFGAFHRTLISEIARNA